TCAATNQRADRGQQVGASMTPFLSKKRLDRINQALYGRNIKAMFYKVTPADGEVEIGAITSGFSVVREQRTRTGDIGAGVKMLLSADANIDRSQLHVGAAVELIVDGRSTRYSIVELLPMQQVGSGYVLRLKPLMGATG